MKAFLIPVFVVLTASSGLFTLLAAPGQIEVCQKAQQKDRPENSAFGFLTPGMDGSVLFSGDLTNNNFVFDGRSQYFGQFDRALKSKGIQLLIVPLPTRPLVAPAMLDRSQSEQATYNIEASRENYRQSRQRLIGMGVESVDILGDVLSYQKSDAKSALFFKRDNHWTSEGSRYFAQTTAQQVKKLGVLRDLKPVQFSNELVNSVDTISWLAITLKQVCDTIIPPEKLNTYQTTRVGGDLLGDDAYPVVLVGSSYSFEPRYNFEGFLKEFLQANVLNTAINAGGFNASFEGYLQSKAYSDNKPKLIVWEFSASAAPWEQTALRELIPSVYGDCSARDALLSSLTQVQEGTTSLLKNTGRELRGPQRFVSLNFSDKSVLRFDLNLKFDDGKQETVKMVRSDRIANEGQFYLKFADEYKGNLSEVTVTPRERAQGTISAKGCSIN